MARSASFKCRQTLHSLSLHVLVTSRSEGGIAYLLWCQSPEATDGLFEAAPVVPLPLLGSLAAVKRWDESLSNSSGAARVRNRKSEVINFSSQIHDMLSMKWTECLRSSVRVKSSDEFCSADVCIVSTIDHPCLANWSILIVYTPDKDQQMNRTMGL